MLQAVQEAKPMLNDKRQQHSGQEKFLVGLASSPDEIWGRETDKGWTGRWRSSTTISPNRSP
jgi:hypothetical protein